MKMDMKHKIGFIGAGNMANAIATGVLSKGLCKPNEMIVSARSKASLIDWQNKGINGTLHNCEVISTSEMIFIAIKPQQFATMVSSLHGDLDRSKIRKFVSVMAGVSIKTIKEALEPIVGKVEVVRVMPNTPLLVGHGCSGFDYAVIVSGINSTEDDCTVETVMCYADDIDKDFEGEIMKIMTSGGTCDIVTESQMNAVTAVSGSGPAYIYMAIEALADGGVKCGLPRALAQKLASQTVVGAGMMVLKTGDHPAVLKDQVCSPGGTTIHAVHALESSGARVAFINAVEAAYSRAASFK